MNSRIQWNTVELLQMKQYIEQNCAGMPLLHQVLLAQQNCVAQDRQRKIESYSQASRAWDRMVEASKTPVPAAAVMPKLILPGPSTDVLVISLDELARFGTHLKSGTVFQVA